MVNSKTNISGMLGAMLNSTCLFLPNSLYPSLSLTMLHTLIGSWPKTLPGLAPLPSDLMFILMDFCLLQAFRSKPPIPSQHTFFFFFSPYRRCLVYIWDGHIPHLFHQSGRVCKGNEHRLFSLD